MKFVTVPLWPVEYPSLQHSDKLCCALAASRISKGLLNHAWNCYRVCLQGVRFHRDLQSSPCRDSLEYKISLRLLALFRWLCIIGNTADVKPGDLVLQKAPITEEKQCFICRRQNDQHDEKGNKFHTCLSCDFPKCESCGRQRTKAEGRRYHGVHAKKLPKEVEPWYCIQLCL